MTVLARDLSQQCTCAGLQQARASGEIVYLPHARAWVFPDGEQRQLSWRARYYLPDGTPDLTGEPFRFVSCPWCGCVLPGTADVRAIADSTGDPNQ